MSFIVGRQMVIFVNRWRQIILNCTMILQKILIMICQRFPIIIVIVIFGKYHYAPKLTESHLAIICTVIRHAGTTITLSNII